MAGWILILKPWGEPAGAFASLETKLKQPRMRDGFVSGLDVKLRLVALLS
jgi:hypothetical protein